MARVSKPISRWQDELRNLQRDCEGASRAEERTLLREAYRIIAEADDTLRAIRRQDFERLLVNGAYESAALGILGPDVGYMLSKGTNGISFATVVVEDREASAVGDSFALALIAALACALRSDSRSSSGMERVTANL